VERSQQVAENKRHPSRLLLFSEEPNSLPAEHPIIEAGTPISQTVPEETSPLACSCPPDVPKDSRRPYLVPNPSHKTIPVPPGIARTAAAAA
jgi:hypothetical protein